MYALSPLTPFLTTPHLHSPFLLSRSLSVFLYPSSLANTDTTDNFAPTTEGPYQKIDKASKGLKKLFKPKRKALQTRLKKIEENGKEGEIKADDQQNDALYICPVQIGTPP